MHYKYEKYFGTETILLVEDDEMVRDSYCDFLESCGYKVIVAVDGQEAVEKYLQDGDKIDLVFSDIIMPRKNGVAAYKDIRAINPNAKYILISGYTPAKLEILDNIPFLKKPFEPVDVIKKIREIIDSV